MVTINNDIPLYAEQITVNQEVEQIQQILNQFKQPVPSNFIELEQLNWMCSTQNWKEPTCERYNCLINSKWSQVDIPHILLNKLGLEKAKNIPYPVYISSTVRDEGLDQYLAYNVKEEKDIFLEKSFTIENLERDINKLLKKIEELAREKNSNKQTIKDLEKAKNDWNNEWLTEWRKKNNLEKEIQSLTQELKGEKQMGKSQKIVCQQKIQHLQTQLTQIQNERDAFPTLPTLTDYLLLQTTITQSQNHLGINDLNNLPELPEVETLTSLLARPTLTQLNELRREKDQELVTANNTINQKNTQITNLTNRVNDLDNELNTTKRELEKEQKWWDKWFSNNHKKRWNLHYETDLNNIFRYSGTNKVFNQIFEGDKKRICHEVSLELDREKGILMIREDSNVSDEPGFNVTRLVFKLLCEYYKNQG